MHPEIATTSVAEAKKITYQFGAMLFLKVFFCFRSLDKQIGIIKIQAITIDNINASSAVKKG
jgi:hypothetical protein